MPLSEWLDQPLCGGTAAWTPFTWRFSGKAVLRFVLFVVLVYQIVLTVLLAINDAYHMNMYTLWALTGYTVAAVLLLAGMFTEGALLTGLTLVVLPLIAGTIVLVAALIIIIIARDADVYVDGSVCEMPPDDDAHSVEVLHTADWLEHGVVVFNWMVVLLVGYEYFHYILVRSLRSWNPVWQWLYFLWWMCGPLVPVVIYQAIFDAHEIYQTSFTVVQLMFLSVAIVWLWMLLLWIAFTARYTHEDLREYWFPNSAELAAGHLSGAGAPNSQSAEVAVPTLINREPEYKIRI